MKQDERKALIGKYILLILGSVLILVPLLATLFSSFKPTKDIVDNFFGFPTNFTWDNFSRLLADGIGGYYWNSVVITVLSLLAVMIFIPMAAYSIARNMSKRKAFTIMYTLLILGIFVPFQVIMIPITVMMSKLGLANTFGLILLYLTYAIPQTLFLYVGYIKISIPESLDEAAEIDGANKFTTYFRIIFPMMKPMHATTMIINALWFWNDFMLPLLVLNRDSKMWTLPLFQYNYAGQYFNDYGPSFASYVVGIIKMCIRDRVGSQPVAANERHAILAFESAFNAEQTMKRDNLNTMFGNILSNAAGFSPEILAISMEEWTQVRAEFSKKARGHKEEVEVAEESVIPEGFDFLSDKITVQED